MTMVVEGQELVSLKLQIVELETVMAAAGQHLAGQDAMVVNFTVDDMIIKDLKVCASPHGSQSAGQQARHLFHCH